MEDEALADDERDDADVDAALREVWVVMVGVGVGATVAEVDVGAASLLDAGVDDGTGTGVVGTTVALRVGVCEGTVVGDVRDGDEVAVVLGAHEASEMEPTVVVPAVTNMARARAGAVTVTVRLWPGATGTPAGVTRSSVLVVKENVCVAVAPFVNVTNAL